MTRLHGGYPLSTPAHAIHPVVGALYLPIFIHTRRLMVKKNAPHQGLSSPQLALLVLLSRAKRDAVWPVFEEYRGQLASRKLKEVDDAYREVAEIIATEGRDGLPYVSIIADETQDFGPQALKLLRAMVAPGQNDLFFVGDGHQRIYSRNRAAMSRCGIDIRGRSRKLYLNYRTTDEIRRQAVALLEGCEIDDLDDGHDETRRYKSLSHGPAPEIKQAAGIEEAAAYAVSFIRDWRSSQGDGALSFCVVGHSEKSRDAVARQLQAAGLACVTISAQSNHTDDGPL